MPLQNFQPIARRFILPAALMIAALAQTAVAVAQTTPSAVPLAPYLGAAWTIQAEIGGKPRTLLFDTAGGITVLTPAAARDIGCAPWGQVTGFRMRGERVDMARCDDVAVRVGDRRLTVPTVGVFDFAGLLPAGAPPIDGSMALDGLAGEIVTIDLAHRQLVVETAASLKPRTATAREVDLKLAREISGRALVPYVAVQSARGKVWLELDTGSDAPVIIGDQNAALFGLQGSKAGQRFRSALVGGVPLTTERARTAPLILDGNIGSPVLRTWIVTLDLKHQRAWIATAMPPDQDRSE